jgi:hypothetical protein
MKKAYSQTSEHCFILSLVPPAPQVPLISQAHLYVRDSSAWFLQVLGTSRSLELYRRTRETKGIWNLKLEELTRGTQGLEPEESGAWKLRHQRNPGQGSRPGTQGTRGTQGLEPEKPEEPAWGLESEGPGPGLEEPEEPEEHGNQSKSRTRKGGWGTWNRPVNQRNSVPSSQKDNEYCCYCCSVLQYHAATVLIAIVMIEEDMLSKMLPTVEEVPPLNAAIFHSVLA